MNTKNDDHTGQPPRDELDSLLRTWHQENRERAVAGRAKLLDSLAEADATTDTAGAIGPDGAERRPPAIVTVIRRLATSRVSHAAAAVVVIAALMPLFLMTQPSAEAATRLVFSPEGGLLEAFDDERNPLGPCELEHTDVDVSIAGPFARITLNQRFHNPHADKIEAVYTFPMSHTSAVDRMKMIIGDRVVIGEVKERRKARQIYQAAKAEGRVTSLLEQERPNIFTQSVANIEPGATISIEISYVETIIPSNGQYTFNFPTTVAPRYIPGVPSASAEKKIRAEMPPSCFPRRGIVLRGPANVTVQNAGDTTRGRPSDPLLTKMVTASTPITRPEGVDEPPAIWLTFNATYSDAGTERGELFTDGTGHVGGRWFWINPDFTPPADNADGGAFAQDTDLVPDASRITPMPAPPSTRAGHDISINVSIDTGGPGIVGLKSELHDVNRSDDAFREDGVARRATVSLKNLSELPNRDFQLTWRQTADTVEEATFAHRDERGGFFTMLIQPPERVADQNAVARELVFVLDVSGSMKGEPIDKAKDVLDKALATLRPQDRFNIITFSQSTTHLWPTLRAATEANVGEAKRFFGSNVGGGGTEMLPAVRAAFEPMRGDTPAVTSVTPAQLADTPADGRAVTLRVSRSTIERDAGGRPVVRVRADLTLALDSFAAPSAAESNEPEDMLLAGFWETANGIRRLRVTGTRPVGHPVGDPLRIIVFLSDGEVGNDRTILSSVQQKPTNVRIFPFCIGNSANRELMDEMARLSGGKAEFVLQTTDAQAAVDNFARRINTPVLTGVTIEFDGVDVSDVIPAGQGFDLYDIEPILVHARYQNGGKGTVIVRGNSAAGPYERRIPVAFPKQTDDANSQIATLWARAKVRDLLNTNLQGVQTNTLAVDLRNQVIGLGETFSIVTKYTSFVAVDRLRVTINGTPRLVRIPIELPSDGSWEGYFGRAMRPAEQLAHARGLARMDKDARRQETSVRYEEGRARHHYSLDAKGLADAQPTPAAPPATAGLAPGAAVAGGELINSAAKPTSRPDARTRAAGRKNTAGRPSARFARIPTASPAPDASRDMNPPASGDVSLGLYAIDVSPGVDADGNGVTDMRWFQPITYADAPEVDLFGVLIDRELGQSPVDDARVAYISAGSDNSWSVDLEQTTALRQSLRLATTPPADAAPPPAPPAGSPALGTPALKQVEALRRATEKSAAPTEATPDAEEVDEAASVLDRVEAEEMTELVDDLSGFRGRTADDGDAIPQADEPADEAQAPPPPTPEEIVADRLALLADDTNVSAPFVKAVARVREHIASLAAADNGLTPRTDVDTYWSHPLFMPLVIEHTMDNGDEAGARALADVYASLYARDPILTGIRDVWADPDMTDEERADAIAAMFELAADRIRTIETAATLRQRLDDDLLKFLAVAQIDTDSAGEEQIIDVVVLVGSGMNAKALERAGLKNPTRTRDHAMFVGTVDSGDLKTLALTDGIRRIEPVD